MYRKGSIPEHLAGILLPDEPDEPDESDSEYIIFIVYYTSLKYPVLPGLLICICNISINILKLTGASINYYTMLSYIYFIIYCLRIFVYSKNKVPGSRLSVCSDYLITTSTGRTAMRLLPPHRPFSRNPSLKSPLLGFLSS